VATSGSTNYSRTAAQIITLAHKLLGLLPSGGSETTAEQTDALELLNLMIKQWQAEGVKLWLLDEAKVFMVDSQVSYNLPGAKACKITELSETTLDGDEASGQTVLSVTKTSNGAGFANSDVIGIVLDDDTIHWTTISSFVTDDTVTVASGLASAASSGNAVYVYTTALERPLRVIAARRELSGLEIQMNLMSRDEYFNLPNKASTGNPVNIYYDPQLTTGKLYVWPAPDSVDYEINITYQRSIEDFDATTNDPDFPQEWIYALASNLALLMAPQFGKSVPQELLATAMQSKSVLADWDQEEASVFF
jgi:hypothetical protein